ncbi:MAG TPA: hypothetical protein VFR86_27020 [Burkholderiaceae bacterium]|nr:hypothetical protein [Burkholderiaceae bacterium]
MRVSVVLLRKDGRRLPRSELEKAPGIEGLLKVFDWRQGNGSRRALRVAELKHPSVGTHADPIQPLFDPVLVRANERGMVLMGFEIRTLASGELIEYAQGWWVRPIPTSGRDPRL